MALYPGYVTADPRQLPGLAGKRGECVYLVADGRLIKLMRIGQDMTDWVDCTLGASGGGGTGPQGPAGPEGPQGPAGADGADGEDGAQGIQGPPGNDGATGSAGPAPSGTGFVKVTAGVLDTPAASVAQSVVTNLVSDLAGKAAASHNHAASDINSGTIATARLGSGTANSSTFLRGDQTWAAPSGGGSDPWTHVLLTQDFITSSASAVAVTGLSFTPAANTTYMFEGMFLVRTATATIGPRPGVSWPTGMTDGIAQIDVTTSATARAMANGNIAAAVLAPVGGLPSTTQSYPATLWGTVVAGASPSGGVQVQLASETAGTNVTMRAGSWIRYRSIA